MAEEKSKCCRNTSLIITTIVLVGGFALKLGMGIQSLILLNDTERTPEDENQLLVAEAVVDLGGAGLIVCSTCALIGGVIYQCVDDS